jgi:hypothetical protein
MERDGRRDNRGIGHLIVCTCRAGHRFGQTKSSEGYTTSDKHDSDLDTLTNYIYFRVEECLSQDDVDCAFVLVNWQGAYIGMLLPPGIGGPLCNKWLMVHIQGSALRSWVMAAFFWFCSFVPYALSLISHLFCLLDGELKHIPRPTPQGTKEICQGMRG